MHLKSYEMGISRAATILIFLICFMMESESVLDEKIINDFVNLMMPCRQIVGMNVVVVKDSKTLLVKGYGKANLTSDIDVDENTKFVIGSISKSFATTTLAQVLHDKNLSWKIRVKDVLGQGEKFYYEDGIRTNYTNLRDIASHNTGLASYNYIRIQELTRNLLEKKIRFVEGVKEFRASYKYDNLQYGIVSRVSEVLDGKRSWEELVQDYIFKPIGMSSSTFCDRANFYEDEFAVGYLDETIQQDETIFREVSPEFQKLWSYLGGSGSIVSSGKDMAKYLKMHLSSGLSENGTEVINEKALKETYDPANQIPVNSKDKIYLQPNIPFSWTANQYALGWRRGFYRGYQMIMHTGTSWGFGAQLVLLPDLGIGIHTSLSGKDDDYHGRRLLHMLIIDQLIGEESWVTKDHACNFPDGWKPQRKHDLHKKDSAKQIYDDLGKYVGTYGNFAYGNITFELKGGSLQMKSGPLGVWDLEETETEGVFLGHGLDHVWAMSLPSIKFEVSDNKVEQVQITFLSSEKPIYQRNLKMSDAPDSLDWLCDYE